MKTLKIAVSRKVSRRFIVMLLKHLRLAMGVTALVVLLLVLSGAYLFQNERATADLKAGKNFDNAGQYTQAKQKLQSAGGVFVSSSTKNQVAAELKRNQQLVTAEQQLVEVKRLLAEHNTAAAQKLLKSIQSNVSSSNSQIAALQHNVTQMVSSSSHGPSSSSSSHSGSGSGSGTGSSGGSGGSGGSGSGGGSPPPPPGPMTGISVNSFSASSSPATSSTCNINDALNFSVNGSGSVTTTWSLFSTKTVSETNNPTTFNFSAAGSQNDSFYFNGDQGLEPGDSYRVSVTITSTSNPSITTTAGPVYISNCASPPALAAEQESPFMTTITPGTPSVYETQDGIFPNECSVQLTTPYSVNSSGTVEAIVMATSSGSVGYTYYDNNGATGFTGSGSNSDVSYFRLPHLPGGGHYSISVKLVEVSSPGTVYATTSSITSACD